jgi:hypothetical protein
VVATALRERLRDGGKFIQPGVELVVVKYVPPAEEQKFFISVISAVVFEKASTEFG